MKALLLILVLVCAHAQAADFVMSVAPTKWQPPQCGTINGGPVTCTVEEKPSPILVLPNGDAVRASDVVAIKAFTTDKWGGPSVLVVAAIEAGNAFRERRELVFQAKVASDEIAVRERDRLIKEWRKVVAP